MRTRSIWLSAVLMAATACAFAQTASGMKDMKMHRDVSCMPMDAGTQKDMPCMNQMAQGTGVVEAVDIAKGAVTIKHQAIAAIHWPAMTMTFKANPPSLLQSVNVDERVNFTLHPAGMNSTVTAITPAK